MPVDILHVVTFYVFAPICSFVLGALFYWAFRKIRARLQARRGPPWYQTFADIVKLFSKETVIPEIANKTVFILAPMLALTGYVSALLQMPLGNLYPPFPGDLIVVLIFLILPGVGVVLGGMASGSPYGAIGASRETMLLIVGEICFVISALVAGIQFRSMNIMEIVQGQQQFGPLALHYPFATAAFLMGAL